MKEVVILPAPGVIELPPKILHKKEEFYVVIHKKHTLIKSDLKKNKEKYSAHTLEISFTYAGRFQ